MKNFLQSISRYSQRGKERQRKRVLSFIKAKDVISADTQDTQDALVFTKFWR